jgi:hypothetical protein
MKKYLKIPLFVLGLFIVLVLLVATGILIELEIEALPQPFDYDDPESLVSLAERTERYIIRANPGKDSPERIAAIKALEDYQAHRRSEYPLKQVAEALGPLVFAQWHNGTHGDDEEEVMAGSEEFFFRYMEQVARLCPHVDYLTSIHTGDDKAGIFTGHEFSEGHQPYYCILLYRHGAGYRTKFLQHFVGYDKIWELSDSAGRNYLLCYNGVTEVDSGEWPFKAILFMEEEGEYEVVCTSEDWPGWEYDCDEGICIDYNPSTHTWTQCRRQGKVRVPVAKRKRLQLVLDGRKSSFEITKCRP